MRIETQIDPGQQVYHITYSSVMEWQVCAFCGGSGEIRGADDTERYCPPCGGRRGTNIETHRQWTVDDALLTVGQITIEYTPEHSGDSDRIFDNYGSQEESRKETVMCYESGIGTGTMYTVGKNVFGDSEAAQAACDRLNADLAEVEA